MAVKEIEIVVRGGLGSGAYSAAQAAAQALEAEGASVDLRTILASDELAPGALRGARVLVRVENPAAPAGNLPATSGRGAGASSGLGQVAKVGIGVVLLLMLFSAELRLNFGLRFDTIFTLAGIGVFWHFALRRSPPRNLAA